MNLQIEILTPVSVGSGEVLSPYSDYVYDKGYVYYLDHDSLLEQINKRPNGQRLIDEFVNVVKGQAKSNDPDKIKLKGFLERNGLDYKKYCYWKLPASEEVREQVQLHVKSAGQPYIPGSSLKGAIRTALLTHLLFLDNEDKFIKYINEEKEKSRSFSYIGQDIFGKFGDDSLKYLQVSDSRPFNQEDMKIVKFYKFNLKNKKLDIPIVKEVLSQGVSTISIKISEPKEELNKLNRKLSSLLFERNEAVLLEIINEYTNKNIEIELEQLQKFKSAETAEIEKFYRSLLESLKSADKKKEAYLRIGSGKTYYNNTIAQKLSVQNIERIVKNNFKKANPKAFPLTRTVVLEGGRREVPGWIKISML